MSGDTAAWVLLAAGAVGQVVAWRLVAARRVSVWAGMGVVSGALGALSLATGGEQLSPRVDLLPAAGVGLVSGVALFLATRLFVRFASSLEAFRRDTIELYGNRGAIPLPLALAIAVGLSAPGEELFWRGLACGRLIPVAGTLGGAAIALALHVAVYATSELLPIVAGAVVGGALWTALFVWTRGVLSPIVSHAAFTGLMLVLPPPVARTGQASRPSPVS